MNDKYIIVVCIILVSIAGAACLSFIIKKITYNQIPVEEICMNVCGEEYLSTTNVRWAYSYIHVSHDKDQLFANCFCYSNRKYMGIVSENISF